LVRSSFNAQEQFMVASKWGMLNIPNESAEAA
jgi:hypothetical protein